MAEAGDHYRSFQSVEIEDQTSSTSVQEQNRILPSNTAGSTKNVSCKICGASFLHGQLRRHHTRTKEHQAALKEFKKKKKEKAGGDEGTAATLIVAEVLETAARPKEKVP
jgi:coenzyme F420-reducing hydrogenase beta subunit